MIDDQHGVLRSVPYNRWYDIQLYDTTADKSIFGALTQSWHEHATLACMKIESYLWDS